MRIKKKNLDIYIYNVRTGLENVMERTHDTYVCVFHRQ